MAQTEGMTRTRSALLSLCVVALALGACAPREAPTTSPATDETSPPEVRTEFLSETDDDSIPNTATTDDAPPKAKPDAPKTETSAPPPEQESTAPSPDGTQPEAGAPPPT
jgi:hypothetical protein